MRPIFVWRQMFWIYHTVYTDDVAYEYKAHTKNCTFPFYLQISFNVMYNIIYILYDVYVYKDVIISDFNFCNVLSLFFSLFVCNFRTPEQCPSVVSLLAESYNPHVRYGAAMALGIACAGTGLREAIALLEPMVKFDPVNFVRQGALVSENKMKRNIWIFFPFLFFHFAMWRNNSMVNVMKWTNGS